MLICSHISLILMPISVPVLLILIMLDIIMRNVIFYLFIYEIGLEMENIFSEVFSDNESCQYGVLVTSNISETIFSIFIVRG
jgi:hypothetical protein